MKLEVYKFLRTILIRIDIPKKTMYEQIVNDLNQTSDVERMDLDDKGYEDIEKPIIRLRNNYLQLLEWKKNILKR